MMIFENEALVKTGIMTNNLRIEKLENGNYRITASQQKRGQKLHEHEFEFTQNGVNALLSMWIAATSNASKTADDFVKDCRATIKQRHAEGDFRMNKFRSADDSEQFLMCTNAAGSSKIRFDWYQRVVGKELDLEETENGN